MRSSLEAAWLNMPSVLIDGGAGAFAAQLRELTGIIVGLVGQHLGDRALGQARHFVAAGINHFQETVALVHGVISPPVSSSTFRLIVSAFLSGEIAGSFGAAAIEAYATLIDRGVQPLRVPFGIGGMFQLRRSPCRAGGEHVGMAAFESNCSLTGSLS